MSAGPFVPSSFNSACSVRRLYYICNLTLLKFYSLSVQFLFYFCFILALVFGIMRLFSYSVSLSCRLSEWTLTVIGGGLDVSEEVVGSFILSFEI